jgi:preprotein translocase subunit SecA
MMDSIKEETVGYLFNVEVQVNQPETDEVQLDAAPQAVPEISAKGLAPARPQHMEYSAPSEDGGVEHGEMESVDGGFIEIDPNASRAERRRLERENRKRS